MKNITLITIVSFIIQNSAFAAYQVIESFSDANSVFQETNITDSGAQATIEDGHLKIEHGDIFSSTSNLFTMIDLGLDLRAESLDSASSIIVYFEITLPTVESTRLVTDSEGNIVFDSYAYMSDGTALSDGSYVSDGRSFYIDELLTYIPEGELIPQGTIVMQGNPVPEGSDGAEIDYENSIAQTTVVTDKAKVDFIFGLYNKDEIEFSTERYNGFNAMCRINSGGFSGRDGDSYQYNSVILDADVTYQVWMEIDFYYEDFRLYIAGDRFNEHNDTYSGTGWEINAYDDRFEISSLQKDSYYNQFRIAPLPEDSVDKFAFITTRGSKETSEKGVDYFYFDNLLVDTEGESITNRSAWVDHPLYGLIYRYATSSLDSYQGEWLYLYDAESFIYIGTESDTGNWVWHHK